MKLTEIEIQQYYDKWITLGWYATGKVLAEFVDPEKTIMETTLIGREDDRLLAAMLTWIRDFGDLINCKRLIRYLPLGDTAILGALIEVAMKNGAGDHLKGILKKCTAKVMPEYLYPIAANNALLQMTIKDNMDPVFKRWGLLTTTIDFYNDAIRPRNGVLNQNPHLALRAILGPTMRAELMYLLLIRNGLHIANIAKIIGYTYANVYNDIIRLAKGDFITFETVGRNKVAFLTTKAKNLINLVAPEYGPV